MVELFPPRFNIFPLLDAFVMLQVKWVDPQPLKGLRTRQGYKHQPRSKLRSSKVNSDLVHCHALSLVDCDSPGQGERDGTFGGTRHPGGLRD